MRIIQTILFVAITMGNSQLLANDNIQLVQTLEGTQQEQNFPKSGQKVPFFSKKSQVSIKEKEIRASNQINAATTIHEIAKIAAHNAWSFFGNTYKALTLKLAPKPELKSS